MNASVGKLPNNIRTLRRSRDMSMDALGLAVGTDASTLNKLEKGHMRLSDRWAVPLARALEVETGALFAESGPLPPPRPPDTALATQRDLPVRGTAAAAHLHGAFLIEPKTAVDMVWRPPSLAGAPDAYAFYCEGDSMMPEFRHGEIYVAHPGRKARPGDTVIVQTRTAANRPVEATLGRLVLHTPERLQIWKRNPESTVDIEIGTVLAVHRVLTNNELFGA